MTMMMVTSSEGITYALPTLFLSVCQGGGLTKHIRAKSNFIHNQYHIHDFIYRQEEGRGEHS